MEVSDDGCQVQKTRLKRVLLSEGALFSCIGYCFFFFGLIFEITWKVGAKDPLYIGDRIFLPSSVREFPEEKQEHVCTNEELNFIQSLELYKVLNLNCLSGV